MSKKSNLKSPRKVNKPRFPIFFMSKYDKLNARKKLEQTITEDLKKALEKRGLNVRHNGTSTNHAPAGKPDIEIWNNSIHINVEVTKLKKAQADREFNSITDHLEKSKRENRNKKCFGIYISPETHYRMANSIKYYNITNKHEIDLKFIPICFSNFELFVNKLIITHKEKYNIMQILTLFERFIEFVDDEKILRIIYEHLFPEDKELEQEINTKEEEKHQKIVEDLIKDLTKLENDLREYRIAMSTDAIKNVILLVFMKLYEEKREAKGKSNRLTERNFLKFQEDEDEGENKKAIHILFNKIKNDAELKECKLFTRNDYLSEKFNDDFIVKFFIRPFEKYSFYTKKVDGIGAAYEVLGKLSGKDTKAGQFFTPGFVVKFMVKLAELKADDIILDPACGTGRFLIYAMEEMIKDVKGKNVEDKIENIKKRQLYGSDDDIKVAKLSKMNMYIHGDGKTNILDKDGLMLYNLDNKVDIILTNPPLGDQSYQKDTYDNFFKIKRMEVIPKKNIILKNLNQYKKKLDEIKEKLSYVRKKQDFKRAKYLLNRKKEYESSIVECENKLKNNECKFEVSGNQMKGGALFLNASKHYLKEKRDSNAPFEWRGGKLLIILDEGILNTATYKEVREFIKKYFYIKAIISLTRDTFVPVSNTTTKTSILYAIKKDDPTAEQKEPIFFAHAEKVGIDTKKKVCRNDLFNRGNDILSKYFEFKERVLKCYVNDEFNINKFKSLNFRQGKINE